jgi:type II secretory pathway pseudopilin PulG
MVELLAVAAIISILAAISFALIARMRSQAIETNAMAALNSLATGYEMYWYDNHSYPQWGPGQPFSSPSEILDHLIGEEFIPRSWSHYKVNTANGDLLNITQDYGLEIPAYDPDDPSTSSQNSYFLVLHPYRFQRDALAIGNSPLGGDSPGEDEWIAVRPRRGREGGNYRGFNLFVYRRVDDYR